MLRIFSNQQVPGPSSQNSGEFLRAESGVNLALGRSESDYSLALKRSESSVSQGLQRSSEAADSHREPTCTQLGEFMSERLDDQPTPTGSSSSRTRRCGMLPKVPGKFRKASGTRNGIQRMKTFGQKSGTDDYYASWLTLQSMPVQAFLIGERPTTSRWPITSINEDRLLVALGLRRADRDQIEGLASVSVRDKYGLTVDQLSSRAIAVFAAMSPQEVGAMQRRTSGWLLRPYPLGLRFSGKNMSPLPGWLSGGHTVALNMSNNDLPLALHFALFNGTGGYVLKPAEMMRHAASSPAGTTKAADAMGQASGTSKVFGWSSVRSLVASTGKRSVEGEHQPEKPEQAADPSERDSAPLRRNTNLISDADEYWPPPREKIHTTTLHILSLHNCPKRSEQRPSYEGSRRACHTHVPELSGWIVPPNSLDQSSPSLTVGLHPIGGFCALSETLPLPQRAEIEISTRAISGSGMNVPFNNQRVHCAAAEPHSTFLSVRVTDGLQELAYETAVLGRLRGGYRVLHLRSSAFGTRIELCYLFVHISFSSEPNTWPTTRQLRLLSARAAAESPALVDEAVAEKMQQQLEEIDRLRLENSSLKDELASQVDPRASVHQEADDDFTITKTGPLAKKQSVSSALGLAGAERKTWFSARFSGIAL